MWDFISTLRHMKMCNMRSYYMYKYKEKHDKMNMGLQLEQYRKLVMQYILVHWQLTIGTLTINNWYTDD